jgi:hypothetical protein
MDRAGRGPAGVVTRQTATAACLGAVAIAGTLGQLSGTAVDGADLGYVLATPLLSATPIGDREGLGALVAWIVGGAVFGAVVGFVVHDVVAVSLTRIGVAGMGVALGGGLGGLVYFLSVGEAEADPDSGITVEMSDERTAPEPRPADLFEDHPDPVLYVADEGGGPLVRAANPAYGETFDLPTTALAGAPLEETLVPAGQLGDLPEALGAGQEVDRELRLETTAGVAAFRVRSIGDPADGYVLFTPLDRS